MQEGLDTNVTNPTNENQKVEVTINNEVTKAESISETLENPKNNVTIVKTDEGSSNGQDKCPRCGATDIETNVATGKLRCNFCRYEFDPVKVSGLVTDISKLEGQVIGSGAQNIVADTNDVLTLKCSSCGAEVVIDTASASQARCHWCRNTLSINEQVPNGSIPDVLLPFNITKDIARAEIEKFVGKRKFFANSNFKKEFTTNNIMGVYFPYMLVDVNAHATLIGEGEHKVRSYYVGSGNNRTEYYDADLYHVERDFDITINGLSVESSLDRLNSKAKDKTNNIINSIMPFDVENCVKYNANYLKGYTSERRDTDIDQLRNLVENQSKDIVRFAANDSLSHYDRGVAWSSENLSLKGEQWQAAYLPVWLYSYQEKKKNKSVLHYVAVNARTKETMGSVPINMAKLILISILIEILGIVAMLNIDFDYNFLFLLSGIIYFFVMKFKYRNDNARHTYESETTRNVSNLRQVDDFIKQRTKLNSARMIGANNDLVHGQSMQSKLINSITSQNSISNITNILNDISKKN